MRKVSVVVIGSPVSCQRMQRYFRDIQMYLVHPSSQPIVQSLYAQNYLGLAVGLPGLN